MVQQNEISVTLYKCLINKTVIEWKEIMQVPKNCFKFTTLPVSYCPSILFSSSMTYKEVTLFQKYHFVFETYKSIKFSL